MLGANRSANERMSIQWTFSERCRAVWRADAHARHRADALDAPGLGCALRRAGRAWPHRDRRDRSRLLPLFLAIAARRDDETARRRRRADPAGEVVQQPV